MGGDFISVIRGMGAVRVQVLPFTMAALHGTRFRAHFDDGNRMRFLFSLLLLIVPVLVPGVIGAQVVETPQAFDSAGRLMSITPAIAARLQLGPPAWRVIGDFAEARLYSIGADAYVLAVTRRDGAVERYSLTGTDRAYLRERTSTLPAQFAVRPERGDRNKFIRNQTLLGLGVYAPAFATAITDDDAGGVSAYLLVAGATFFGASQLARDFTITPAMRSLSTHGALHTAAAGGALAFALGAGDDDRDPPDDGSIDDENGDDVISAGIFVGGLGGTAAGLYFGKNMTSGQAVASGFGADVSALTMLGVIVAVKGGDDQNSDDLHRGDAALLVAAGAAGYPLGYWYARRAPYNVTGGDIGTLWVTGLLGAATTGAFITTESPGYTVTALTLTGGFLGGLYAGDRIFVRRFDHTAGDATQLFLGGVAGGLIGLGIANLIEEADEGHLALGLFSAGAAGGIALTHALIEPGGDEGRFSSLRFNPTGAALAATGMRGRYPIFSLTF